jgi:hypothetical protein
MSVISKLVEIQAELKVPKNQFNKFGGYSYRSAEDIQEAAKPVLSARQCALTLDDSVVMVGNRYYIKAVATLHDAESGESFSTSAQARESEVKKGMDDSQITGSASSYARKYALSGLFALDDGKDSDYTNHGDEGQQPQQKPQYAQPQQWATAPRRR